MSINTIVKSDGTVVAFEPEKLHKWASFASDNEVEWSSIVLDAYKKCYDGCSTKDIQQAMISACVEREDEKHLRMAGRLLLGGIYKEAHGGYNSIPTLKDFFHSMINRGLWTEMDYSDKELDKLESVIDHSKNLSKNYSYTALKQMRDKYMNQDLISRKCFESPQFMFMGVALNSMENQPKETRLDNVARTYEYLSDLKINLSTPMLVNLRTPKKGLASCCVYTTKDTAESLATGDHIAYMMTCASAGIGSHLTTRSIGDPVRNGAVIHQGKLPYLRMIQSAVHANKQACYDDKTKVLTNTGFKLFKDLNDDDLVAQVHDDGTIDFVEPIEGFVYDFKGNLVNFKLDENVQLPVTPNHTMVYSDLRTETVTTEQASLDSNIQFKTSRADEIVIENGIAFKVSGHTKNRDSINLHNLDLLMGVLLTSDVTYNDDGFVIIVDENREIIEKLCDKLELEFNGVYVGEENTGLNYSMKNTNTFIKTRMETFLTRISTMMITEFVDFLRHIHQGRSGRIPFYSIQNKEYLQSILAISGKYFTTNTFNEKGQITILDDVTSHIDATAFEVEEFEYDGKVYCLEVPTNKLIVQREDLTLICGNSRGGANTTYFSVLDPEINDLIALKNPTTIQQKRIRDIDYAMNVNKLFVEKVARNEEWFTISYHYAKDLHDAFYSSDYELFKMLYENYKDHEHAVHYKARDIALKALTESVETGRLYIHYVDEANRHTPFAVGSGADDDKIYSSNLCIAGDQLVATNKGLFTAEELYKLDEELMTFDGEKINKTSKMKLREKDVPTYKITLSNGMTHTVTDYHEVMTDRGLVACKDLELGVDKVKINHSEGIFGTRSDMRDEAFLLGLYEGDGTQHTKVGTEDERYIHIDLYENKTLHLSDEIQEIYNRVHEKYDANTVRRKLPNCDVMYDRFYETPQFLDIKSHKYKKKRLSSRMLAKELNFQKGVIPNWIMESDKETQISYLRGVFLTDGSIGKYNNIWTVALTTIDKDWICKIQTMLNNMGIVSGLYADSRSNKNRLLPDGKGGFKEYFCKQNWTLSFSNKHSVYIFDSMINLADARGKTMDIDVDSIKLPSIFSKVVSVEYVGDQDVYCPTVYSEEHLFVSNCFITKNCLEIEIPTKGYTDVQDLYSEDSVGEVGLCSLSSIVQGRVSEEEYEDVAYHTLMLVDNTLEIMDYPFPSLRSTARKRRNIGIGMTNLAYDIASRGLSYTTQEGKEYIHKVAERHAYYLYKGSLRLAKEKGNAEWMHKTKYPQGWLPIDTYNKNVDSVVENNLTYDWETLRKDIIKQGGIRNSTVTAIPPNESSSLLTNTTNSIYPIRSLRVIKTSGTNRNILLAPDYETLKDKYDIAWNMKSKDLIELYAIVQKFTDQGISSDLYVTYKDSQLVSSRDLLSDFILMAKLGCKSRYYINSQSGVDIKETEVIDTSGQCEACVL